jgi:hypothetical protein
MTSSLASTVPRAGAPVHGDLVLVGEALLEQLEEDPLRPADVARIGRRELAVPVVENPSILSWRRKVAMFS